MTPRTLFAGGERPPSRLGQVAMAYMLGTVQVAGATP